MMNNNGMLGTRARQALATLAAPLLLGSLASTCSSPKPTPSPAPVQQLWGEMKPVVSVKELMRDFIDPASDYVFDSISTVITKKGGIIEKFPKTDDDWDKVRFGAVMMAEGVYLLKVP